MFARSFRLATSKVARRGFSSGGGGGGSSFMPVALVGTIGGVSYAFYEMDQKNSALSDKVDDLQGQLSGKTNSAFVFIKPHACKGAPGKVEALVEEKLKAAGIRITDKGEMLAETIDKNMHIDTHYGAIASKAVKLKPSELNVPEKGQKQFQEMFGEKWTDVVAAGKVYNAKDAAEKLGIDAAGLNEKWSKLKRGSTLIKFGGGAFH